MPSCWTTLFFMLCLFLTSTTRTQCRRFANTRRFFWFDRARKSVEQRNVALDRGSETIVGGFNATVCSIQGAREYMEDEFVTTSDFVGIFDGHGGSAVSQYLRFNMYGALQRALTGPTITDYVTAMEKAIHNMDEEICKIHHWSFQGSTCCAVWVLDPNHFVIANTGDSRAILSRNHTGLDITKDHKPHDEEELQRIEQAGGMVTWESGGIPRVNGNLALSRSLGDRSERPAVCATPDLFVLDVSQQDEFIVLATDGLWYVVVVCYVCGLLSDRTRIFFRSGTS